MRKIHESLDFALTGHFRNLLVFEGIPAVIKNEFLAVGAGEIPQNECWYEIWIEDDAQYEEADKIIKAALSADVVTGPDWICPHCQEVNEYQFALCWNCGEQDSQLK